MLDRWVNIFFFLALVFVFILAGSADDHGQIIIGLLLASTLAIIAFIFNWLTIDGAVAAGIFGSFAYGLGGIPGAAVILAFFISGSLLSKDLISKEGFLEKRFRRDGVQVWANGFWFALWILVWFLGGVNAFLIAAVTAVAAATSDTWATEIGAKRFKAKARLITTRKKVQPGTDGGVSVIGTVAAFFGAVFVAVIFWISKMDTAFSTILIVSLTGFTGCFIDSYIGARFQNRNYDLSQFTIIKKNTVHVGNNFVNWISAGIASTISLILILIIGT